MLVEYEGRLIAVKPFNMDERRERIQPSVSRPLLA